MREIMAKGQKIGNYTLLERLGLGGMGDVWLAVDELGRNVAIKMMPGGVLVSEKEKQRFIREAQVLSQFQHQNIRRIYSVENLDNKPCLIMEYEQGVSQVGSYLYN